MDQTMVSYGNYMYLYVTYKDIFIYFTKMEKRKMIYTDKTGHINIMFFDISDYPNIE